ncbi:MAG: hypothetical protein V3V68_05060 [Nitrosomonadaceae bacterium]
MKTVFLARNRYGAYYTSITNTGSINDALVFGTREAPGRYLEPEATFDIVEFRLVEVKPTVRITLTSEGTRGVWIKVFPNFDLKNPLRRTTLDRLLLREIKEEVGQRSEELIRLRTMLQFALPEIKTYDIELGGVLLGHIEYEVIK